MRAWLLKRTAQRFRHALTGKVVFSRAQTAHEDDDIGARKCNTGDVNQVRTAIAHNGLETYFHAQPVQLLGEEERVRVLAERSQQLRSDGDDLSVHVSSLNERKALHAPGEMENGVGGDQHCSASPRECQPNQRRVRRLPGWRVYRV